LEKWRSFRCWIGKEYPDLAQGTEPCVETFQIN
jgi:hypothetical protein